MTLPRLSSFNGRAGFVTKSGKPVNYQSYRFQAAMDLMSLKITKLSVNYLQKRYYMFKHIFRLRVILACQQETNSIKSNYEKT